MYTNVKLLNFNRRAQQTIITMHRVQEFIYLELVFSIFPTMILDIPVNNPMDNDAIPLAYPTYSRGTVLAMDGHILTCKTILYYGFLRMFYKPYSLSKRQ